MKKVCNCASTTTIRTAERENLDAGIQCRVARASLQVEAHLLFFAIDRWSHADHHPREFSRVTSAVGYHRYCSDRCIVWHPAIAAGIHCHSVAKEGNRNGAGGLFERNLKGMKTSLSPLLSV